MRSLPLILLAVVALAACGEGGAGGTPGPIGADPAECIDAPIGPGRPESAVCARCRPPGDSLIPAGECTVDSECRDGDNGRCVLDRRGLGTCSYDECFLDADCGPGLVCACDAGAGGGNACVAAGCALDSDCEEGQLCAPSFGACGPDYPIRGFYCTTIEDSCLSHEECAPGYCAFDEDIGRYVCTTSECV